MKVWKDLAFVIMLALCSVTPAGAQARETESLEDLLNTEIDTAARYNQTISEAPASITVITHEDIFNYGYQTLDQVLAAVPGFYTTLDRNYGYIGTRGFSRPTDYNNRVLVMINGQKINENFYGFASIWTELGIDLKSLERIEIIRGPGSALYGTGAMLAVINLVTKTGATIDGVEVNARSGSFGTVGGDLRLGKSFENGADWMFSAQWENINGPDLYFPEFNSPDTNFGMAQGRDWDRWYGILTTYSKNGFLFQFNATDRKKGIPTASYETVFNSSLSNTDDQRQSVRLGWSHQLNDSNLLVLNAGWNRYAYAGAYAFVDGLLKDQNLGQWLDTELRWQCDNSSRNRFIAGMDYVYNATTKYKSVENGVIGSDMNFPYSTFSLYVQDEYQLIQNLSLTLGIRYDDALKSNAFSPRMALIYHARPKSTFKLLYGEAFRAPNVYETYYAEGSFKINPELQPERMKTTELIWQQRVNDVIQTEFSLYHYKMKNLIDTTIDPVDSFFVFRNLNNVQTNGLEVSAILRSPLGLQGYGSYTYENAVDEATHVHLTNSPKHIGKLGLVVPLQKNLQIAAELRYESGRKTVYDTETGSALLTNLTFTGSLPSKTLSHFPITFKIQNLFDVDYSTPGGFEHRMPAINQNGRNYLLEVGYRFDLK